MPLVKYFIGELYKLRGFFIVMDFINWIVQILKRELVQLRISIQDARLIDPVELWDEG